MAVAGERESVLQLVTRVGELLRTQALIPRGRDRSPNPAVDWNLLDEHRNRRCLESIHEISRSITPVGDRIVRKSTDLAPSTLDADDRPIDVPPGPVLSAMTWLVRSSNLSLVARSLAPVLGGR